MPESSPEYITEHQVRFSASGQVTQAGHFEILCITAGVGNGWHFSPEVLQASLALWAGVHCFIDHAWLSRSVRDLAGQIVNPVWDADAQGIHATLTTIGPGGELLSSFGHEVLKSESPPKIGFSADILFKANNKQVTEITRVLSVDLVYDPARGGAFLRALNHIERLNPMPENTQNPLPPDPPANQDPPNQVIDQLQADHAAMRSLLDEQKRQAQLDQALQEARKTRVQMCGYLLESGLNASKLPKPIQDRIRAQFDGKVFEAAELQDVINDHRQLLADLSAAQTVSGPGRISSMFDEKDKLQAAVDDLFEAPREEKLQNLSVPKLSGVRELYLMLTGDHDLHGGYHPDRVHLATTADFTGLVKNALNKLVINQWNMLGRAGYDWWKQITVQEHFSSLQDITGTLIGTVGDLPVVAEGAEYTELQIGDSPETASFVKYGGYIPLTLELIDRDQTRKLKAYARELGSAGIRKISSLVSAIFTANSGVGPTMADTGDLFNSTAVTTAGGHANLLTTALAIAAWDAACAAVYNQPLLIKNVAGLYGTGPKMAINPKFLLVPRTLQNTAWQLLTGSFVNETDKMYDNVLKGSGVPVTVPEWTDANDWAAVCDPAVAPAIYVGERFGLMPEIYVAGDELSPAVFMNDEHRLKVRHFLAVWVNDFRPLHKSNVA
ncbi:MAG: hypothetical protein K0B06_04055 [Brevefilum sp.]|nr:hypothetical protein [Brevefilum sp.]